MTMTLMPDVHTPEMASWMRSIARQVFREQTGMLRKERRDELVRLEATVAELAEAQKHAEERLEGVEDRLGRLEAVVTELAEAQKRTEAAVAELVEAQKRSEKRLEGVEKRLESVEVTVTDLSAVQQKVVERLDKLDHRIETLDHRVEQIDHRVGLIGNLLGIEAEGEAEEILVHVLEQKGYRLLEAPYALAVDGKIDVVMRAETPAGEQVWVLIDVKARARLKELRRWSGRLRDPAFQQRLADAGVKKPFLPYFFGLRVYQIVDDEARRLGIGVLDPNGERVGSTLLR